MLVESFLLGLIVGFALGLFFGWNFLEKPVFISPPKDEPKPKEKKKSKPRRLLVESKKANPRVFKAPKVVK